MSAGSWEGVAWGLISIVITLGLILTVTHAVGRRARRSRQTRMAGTATYADQCPRCGYPTDGLE